ncbi:MAG: MarR family transcriptional regulator, partial [Chloroflexota bacterium]
DGDGVAMGELAERWGCDASYMTSLADDLESHGFVRREAKATDRRTRLLVLTEDGLAARERAHGMLTEPPADLEALNGDEQRQLRDLLSKIGVVGPELLFTPRAPRTAKR